MIKDVKLSDVSIVDARSIYPDFTRERYDEIVAVYAVDEQAGVAAAEPYGQVIWPWNVS